jgi:formylglycine-generating enzyme
MKFKTNSFILVFAFFAGVHQSAAQGMQFFRVSGPMATTITSFQPDGTMVLSNVQAGATYTIQTVSSLPGGTNWVDFIKWRPGPSPVPIFLTNKVIDFNPPPGMAFIPAGSFTMGDSLDGGDDDIPTDVTASAFYMDVNLVSFSLWQSVYGWATNQGYVFDSSGAGKAADNPVQSLDWFDAVKWCNARSEMAGLPPVYYMNTNLTHVYRNTDGDVCVDWTASGFRLPTEAEWEKAARGGLSGKRFPWGDTISESQANYYGLTGSFSYDLGPNGPNAVGEINGFPWTSPVGYFAANGYGLRDMAGNVYEWCWDWYGTPYAGGADPRGPTDGNYRVYRGGQSGEGPDGSRCANRGTGNPYTVTPAVGLRCVRGY